MAEEQNATPEEQSAPAEAAPEPTSEAVPERVADLVSLPLDHPFWSGVKEWVKAEIAASRSAMAASANSRKAPAAEHAFWDGIKAWARREVDLGRSGLHAEDREEQNP